MITNPQSNEGYLGYGLSLVEQAIDFITGWVNGTHWTSSYFTQNSVPKQLLHIVSNLREEEKDVGPRR